MLSSLSECKVNLLVSLSGRMFISLIFLIFRPSDVGLGAVLSNNIVSVNKEQNVFDSRRKMKAATSENIRSKLTAAQKQTIAVNQCLLHMYSNQVSLDMDDFKESCLSAINVLLSC